MKAILTRFFLLASFLILAKATTAQSPGDTIVVGLFDYNSTTRDTMISFSNLPDVDFERVLMHYNMRCHGGEVNNTGGNNWGPNGTNACGEWDYSCNTYLYDDARVDSVAATHPDFIISGFSGTTYNYAAEETYTFLQHTQYDVSVDETISETIAAVESGTSALSEVLNVENATAKSQFLFSAAELTSAGLTAGDITGLRLNVSEAGGDANFFRIKLKSVDGNTLTQNSPETDGFTEVYFQNYAANTGENQFQFYAPFNWDGTSNLLVEFNFSNAEGLSPTTVEGGTAPASTALSSAVADRYLQLDTDADQYIDLPDSEWDFSEGLTITTWIKYNSFNNWSRIIDFGNGPNSDNIILANQGTSNNLTLSIRQGSTAQDILATNVLVTDEWIHLAATIDASGNATIYVNGEVEASGNVSLPLNNLLRTNNYIGESNWSSDGFLNASIDEISFWSTALTAAQVEESMYQDLDPFHPQFDHVLFAFNFNEEGGAFDLSANDFDGSLSPFTAQPYFTGNEIFKNLAPISDRPSLDFVQGVYGQTTTEVAVLDSVLNTPNIVTEYEVSSNVGTALSDEIVAVNVTAYWSATDQDILDALTGENLGTIEVETSGSIQTATLDYFQRYPSKFELMSFVTPYGIGLDMTPTGRTWTFDMTDFLPLFNEEKRITVERAGSWQEEMDVKLLFIVGTPPRDVVDIRQIWRTESRGYTAIMNDDFFPPRDFPTSADAAAFKIRSAISGHGQEGEFIPRTHWVDIDGGTNEFSWQVWKECAKNPLFPQGGTWVYDRAGWCPGMATDVQEWDITEFVVPGETVNVDYGLNSASGTSNYIVNHQLVSYGEANFTTDARIVEVRKPSSRFEFDRTGTVCRAPEVVLQNTGSSVLTSVNISYWINDATEPENFEWTGNLEMMETIVVVLPADEGLWATTAETGNVFYAEIEGVNGAADEYPLNNKYESPFEVAPVLPEHLIILFRTNNVPSENSYELRDAADEVIFERDGMSSNTLYRDTLMLEDGCYTFEVFDTGDDGLSWWANNDGNGYTRLKEVSGPTLEFFEADYGDGIIYEFTVDGTLSIGELSANHQFDVYPNPTNGNVSVRLSGFDTDVRISIFNSIGQVVQQKRVKQMGKELVEEMNLENLENGVYLIQLSDGIRTATKKVVKQ